MFINSIVFWFSFDFFFFFFKQKTAYEMRISDWSSDVCSSDLLRLNKKIISYSNMFYCKAKYFSNADVMFLFLLKNNYIFLHLKYHPDPDRKSTRLNSSH